MDLTAQRKRRAPITYGKLYVSRRKIPNSFGDGFNISRHGDEDVAMSGGEPSPPKLQDSLSSSSSNPPEASGNKAPEFTPKEAKSSMHVPSRNDKHGLERANSTSKIEITDQNVFDVPSSDEDVPKLKPTIRRALSSSQKKFRAGRLEENRIQSTDRSERALGVSEEAKTSRPMVTLGKTASRSTMRKTKGGDTQITYSRTASKASTAEKIDTKALAPQKRTQSLDLKNLSTGQKHEGMKRSVPPLSSVQTEEKQKAWLNPKFDEKSKLEGKPLPEEGPIPVGHSKTDETMRAEEVSKIVGGVPGVVDAPLTQRRPRKQREPKPFVGQPGQQFPLESTQLSVPKLKKAVCGATPKKKPARPPSNSPTRVRSLYISSPVLEVQEPLGAATKSLISMQAPAGGPSLWDDIMGGTGDSEDQIVRNSKRSRESETSEGDMERRPTPPRRRRLIDALEGDRSVRRPKKRTLEAEVDDDSGSESGGGTPMVTLKDSRPLTEPANADQLENTAQMFQRGVGAIQSAPVFPQRNARVTYARQRSFLTEEVKEGGDPFADPLLLPVGDFGRGLRKAPVVEEEDEEDHGPGMMKSLHELREAGVNKRFLDSVEGYFEDIERNFSLGQKRVGYIELATKLRDKIFLQKFRANNFERRLLKDFGKQDDEIVRFILCFTVWSFLEEDSSSPILKLVHKKGIIPMLDSMLDSARDMKIIAKDKKTNMSKAAQSLLLEFCDIIKSSKVFGGKAPKALSPQILALAVLDSVMKGLRRAGFMGDCLPKTTLKKLVKTMVPFQVTADLNQRKQVDPLFIELPISILESYSIGRDSAQDIRFLREDLDVLANIVPGVMQLDTHDFKPIQLLILRLHINLTNHRPDICDTFGKLSVIKALVSTTNSSFEALAGPLDEEARLIQLDMLVLSLALMINFAEMSNSAGLAFVEGPYATSQLSVLLKLFLSRMERAAEADSMEETQSNVAFGYLSILLGNLCHNTTVRNVVRSQMPKKNLEPLVNAVQEFVSHNQKVDEETTAMIGGDGENWHKGFTERLEQVAIRLKAAEGYS